MKVILDIKDSKADFILELLEGFSSYVKTKPLSPAKAKVIDDLIDSSNDVRLHKEGKIKLKSAEDLINEL
ncbi:MAG: hypothetical protein EOO89_19030 [Pedobacter sp.]|nr:MAG: hypothetical protein EOO89_19030 [Pedobacter sp.]